MALRLLTVVETSAKKCSSELATGELLCIDFGTLCMVGLEIDISQFTAKIRLYINFSETSITNKLHPFLKIK